VTDWEDETAEMERSYWELRREADELSGATRREPDRCQPELTAIVVVPSVHPATNGSRLTLPRLAARPLPQPGARKVTPSRAPRRAEE
jgi:hypothetical protein